MLQPGFQSKCIDDDVRSAMRVGKHFVPRESLRVIAGFEAFKGLRVLVMGAGLLSQRHQNLYALALSFIEHMHLNPAAHYPHIFLNLASALGETKLWLLALGCGLYAAVRCVEAYGLFFEKAWAEILAAASSGVYAPFELYALVQHPRVMSAFLLCINVAIVAVMISALIKCRAKR